jgi:RHS repeat-associated protein
MVVSNGGNYTKHIYVGSQRITSKVSNSGIFTASPVKDTLQAKYTALTTKIKERFDSLGVAYNGTQHTGGLISSSPSAAGSLYYYHSDHLGSSSLITDDGGNLVQHVEYVPFGETFIDERNGSWHTPYLFNAKEQDEETGLHYYGARYYDSRTSVWLSVDPLAEKYPNYTSYNYCLNNPVKYIDPDGKNPLAGALIGAGLDVLFQLADIYVFETRKSIDWIDVGISAGAGAIGLGLANKFKKLEKITGIGGDELADIAADLTKIYKSSGKIGLGDIAETIISNSKAGDIGKVLKKLGLGKYFFKSFNDIIGGSKLIHETKGHTKIYKKSGTYSTAEKDFQRKELNDIKEIDTKYGKGKMGTNNEGETIIIRPGSSEGPATMERQVNGRKKQEIRYENQ